jgi:hypothetical protein
MASIEADGRKQHENALCQARKIADRGREVLAVHGASLIERYVQADCHICIRGTGVSNNQYGFLIEAVPLPDFVLASESGVKPYSSWKYKGVQETAMFPGQVQIMEGKQQIIPSRIWFQTFDDVLIDLGKPLYLFQNGICLTAGRSIEILLGFPDGKSGFGGIREAIAVSQAASENIQAAADAMDDSARLRVDDGIKLPQIGKAIELFSRLRFCVYSDGVGLAVSPLADTFFEDWELGYGPIDSSF